MKESEADANAKNILIGNTSDAPLQPQIKVNLANKRYDRGNKKNK